MTEPIRPELARRALDWPRVTLAEITEEVGASIPLPDEPRAFLATALLTSRI